MPTAILIISALLAVSAGGNVVVYKLDFGPLDTCAEGYLSAGSDNTDLRTIWKGRSLGMRDRGGDDMVNRDLVIAKQGELLVALDNGKYQIEITFGDLDSAHGPCNVFAQDELVIEKLKTNKGEFVAKTFRVDVDDEKLRVKFVPVDGVPNFAVTSMVMRGKKQTKEHSLYPKGMKTIPTVTQIEERGKPERRKALKLYCDWLLAHQTESGFFNHNTLEWYRSSYPMRVLIAGYDVFGEKKYRDAVAVCLDKLIGEQLPNGAWPSNFFDKPVGERTKEEIRKAMSGTTNCADVGSISTCLAIAYPYVDDARKERYRNALKRYSVDYAAQWQLPSGGFTNGRWGGKDMTTPYSVATATQGMNFCSLYVITGNQKYLKIAERCANFLLDNWKQDGRPIHYHHAHDTTEVLDVTAFGNIYYYHEAILWVWHWTKDQALKEKIRRVYTWHIKGAKGLLQARENSVWWPSQDTWTNAKGSAMPLVLIEYDRSMFKDPRVHQAVERCAAFLCNPDFAARAGLMCEPDRPWGTHSMEATGFGGLSLAELTKPGVIYLKSEKVKAPKRITRR